MKSESKDSKGKSDSPIENGDKKSKIYWDMEKATIVEVNIDLTKFKWKVGKTFGVVARLKDAIVRFALAQGFDLHIGVYVINLHFDCFFSQFCPVISSLCAAS